MSDSTDNTLAPDSSRKERRAIEAFRSEDLVQPSCLDRPTDTSEPSSDDRDFLPLDVRAIRLWRLEGILFVAVLWSALLVVGCALWAFSPVPKPLILLVWLLAVTVSITLVVWWPKKCYANWSYCVEPQTLELRCGVVWKVSILIPLSRVQHVDLHRGPLERQAGLASVQIHTAGTRDASHRLPALEIGMASQLRQRLITFSNGESS